MQDARAGVRHRIDIAARHRRDAAGALQEVEERALGEKHAPERATQRAGHRARQHAITLVETPRDRRQAARREHCVGVPGAGQHRVGPNLDDALRLRVAEEVVTSVVTSRAPSSARARRARRRGIVEHLGGSGQSPGFLATPGPSATMRSTAARARAAMSGGTETW